MPPCPSQTAQTPETGVFFEQKEKHSSKNGRSQWETRSPFKKCLVGNPCFGRPGAGIQARPGLLDYRWFIAAQNMILAAHALGICSVWLGTYPQMERVNNLQKLFNLPETVIPHSIIAFGYPDEDSYALAKGKGFYEEDRVHIDRW